MSFEDQSGIVSSGGNIHQREGEMNGEQRGKRFDALFRSVSDAETAAGERNEKADSQHALAHTLLLSLFASLLLSLVWMRGGNYTLFFLFFQANS